MRLGPELGLGFIAGAASAITFHQPVAAILGALGLFPAEAFVLTPRPPLGLPVLVHAAFFAGVWGAVLVGLLRLLPRRPALLPAAILFCGTVPIGWLFLVMAPMKGFPIAFGMPLGTAALVVFSHLAWGFGIALWMTGLRGLRAA